LLGSFFATAFWALVGLRTRSGKISLMAPILHPIKSVVPSTEYLRPKYKQMLLLPVNLHLRMLLVSKLVDFEVTLIPQENFALTFKGRKTEQCSSVKRAFRRVNYIDTPRLQRMSPNWPFLKTSPDASSLLLVRLCPYLLKRLTCKE